MNIPSSLDDKFNRREISTINLFWWSIFSFIDSDKIFIVHNLKDLSRDLRSLSAVKIYSVCRRYELIFYSIKARLCNLNINTFEHHLQDLHFELTHIVQLFDHVKRKYESAISSSSINVSSTSINQKCYDFMFGFFLIDVKKDEIPPTIFSIWKQLMKMIIFYNNFYKRLDVVNSNRTYKDIVLENSMRIDNVHVSLNCITWCHETTGIYIIKKTNIFISLHVKRGSLTFIISSILSLIHRVDRISYYSHGWHRLQRQDRSEVIIDAHTAMLSSIFSGVRVVYTFNARFSIDLSDLMIWNFSEFYVTDTSLPFFLFLILLFLTSLYFRIRFRLTLARSVFCFEDDMNFSRRSLLLKCFRSMQGLRRFQSGDKMFRYEIERWRDEKMKIRKMRNWFFSYLDDRFLRSCRSFFLL